MKVAILVPHYGDVKARFAKSLAGLMAETAGTSLTYNGRIARPELMLDFAEDGPLEYKRTRLVNRALEWGADYILTIDTDHTFAPNALLRLAQHDLPIVGCNYPTRQSGKPTARDAAGNRIATTEEKARAGVIEGAAGMGLGFCLMKAPIFNRIERPWFVTQLSPAGEILCGEDLHFFAQAAKAGFTAHIDHRLSWELGHLAERIVTFGGEYSNADSVLPASGP